MNTVTPRTLEFGRSRHLRWTVPYHYILPAQSELNYKQISLGELLAPSGSSNIGVCHRGVVP